MTWQWAQAVELSKRPIQSLFFSGKRTNSSASKESKTLIFTPALNLKTSVPFNAPKTKTTKFKSLPNSISLCVLSQTLTMTWPLSKINCQKCSFHSHDNRHTRSSRSGWQSTHSAQTLPEKTFRRSRRGPTITTCKTSSGNFVRASTVEWLKSTKLEKMSSFKAIPVTFFWFRNLGCDQATARLPRTDVRLPLQARLCQVPRVEVQLQNLRIVRPS